MRNLPPKVDEKTGTQIFPGFSPEAPFRYQAGRVFQDEFFSTRFFPFWTGKASLFFFNNGVEFVLLGGA